MGSMLKRHASGALGLSMDRPVAADVRRLNLPGRDQISEPPYVGCYAVDSCGFS